MRAVDTHVVVRLLTRDDPGQVRAAERFIASGAWVSLVVLAEVSWVLQSVYDLPNDRIARAIEMLLEHEQLVLQDADTVADALSDFRDRPALGFSDCLVVALARAAGHTPLGTSDRDLAKLGDTERLTARAAPSRP